MRMKLNFHAVEIYFPAQGIRLLYLFEFFKRKKATLPVAFSCVIAQRLLYQINDSFESCWVVKCQVGKYFAVEFDATGM